MRSIRCLVVYHGIVTLSSWKLFQIRALLILLLFKSHAKKNEVMSMYWVSEDQQRAQSLSQNSASTLIVPWVIIIIIIIARSIVFFFLSYYKHLNKHFACFPPSSLASALVCLIECLSIVTRNLLSIKQIDILPKSFAFARRVRHTVWISTRDTLQQCSLFVVDLVFEVGAYAPCTLNLTIWRRRLFRKNGALKLRAISGLTQLAAVLSMWDKFRK